MRKYEHLKDEELHNFSQNPKDFNPDSLWEIENEQRLREIEKSEIKQMSDEKLTEILLEAELKNIRTYTFKLKYVLEETIHRSIPIDKYIFEQKLRTEIADLDTDISKNGRHYKKANSLATDLRMIAWLWLICIFFSWFFKFIGIFLLCTAGFTTLRALAKGLEMLADIERNGRIQLLMQEKKDK